MPTTTIFTSCNKAYEPFALPYIVSALEHNDDAAVEICMEYPEEFLGANKEAMVILNRVYPDRVLIRGGRFAGVLPHSVRFLETPMLRSDYTYIGDIDILLLERKLSEIHLRHMQRTGLPYSNVLRPKDSRLTGLHFTRTDVHYPLCLPSDINLRGSDEQLLYRLVESKGLPLPDPTDQFRPSHGYHISLNRKPTAAEGMLHWGLSPVYLDAYLTLVASSVWQELSLYFSFSYRLALLILDSALQALFPDREIFQTGEARRLFDDLAGTTVRG